MSNWGTASHNEDRHYVTCKTEWLIPEKVSHSALHVLRLLGAGAALAAFGAAVGLKDFFPHAEGLGGNFDKFVLGDELDRLL